MANYEDVPENLIEAIVESNRTRKKQGSFAFTAIEMIDESGNILKRKNNIKEEVNYKILLKNTMIATSSVILDKEKVGEFKMPLIRSGQDYATWLLLLHNGAIAYGINEPLVKYRRTVDSLSSKKLKNFKKVWNIQIKQEGIHPIMAFFNCICYALNALKKYYL